MHDHERTTDETFAPHARAVDDEQYGRCARCDWRLELDALGGAKTMRNRDVSASGTAVNED
jgi:hypothetical protein